MKRLVPNIMAWLVVVITLALGPTIVTYNTAVTTNVAAATNKAYMLGMTAIDDFGGFLIIMGLLVSGGFFATKFKGASIRDMLSVIGAVIATVIALAIFAGTVIGYLDAMITAGSGFEKTAYGIITVILYVGIIAGASAYIGSKTYRRGRKKSLSRYM